MLGKELHREHPNIAIFNDNYPHNHKYMHTCIYTHKYRDSLNSLFLQTKAFLLLFSCHLGDFFIFFFKVSLSIVKYKEA